MPLRVAAVGLTLALGVPAGLPVIGEAEACACTGCKTSAVPDGAAFFEGAAGGKELSSSG